MSLASSLNVYNLTILSAETVTEMITNSLPTEEVLLFATDAEVSLTPSVGTIIWAFINFILFFGIICGNTLTIIAVRTCRRLKSLISNLFILSLAISDLIVGLALPYHLSFYLGSDMGKSRELCLMRFFLIIFACCVSILTLIAIAVDRYIAIVFALHYRRFMTRRVALIIIAFSWLIGATVAAIPMFWNHWNTASQCEFDEILPPWYMAGVITPGFIMIWIFMLLVYWRIIREASKHAKQLRNSTSSGRPSSTQSDWKSVQVVLFIMGCFSICWLPYFIVACAQIFDVYKTTSVLYKAAFSLAMSNSGFNPIIYSWKNSNFRKAFGLLLRCKSPNNCQHNLDASQYSIRSHYMPRQQSSNSMIVVAITPLTCMEQQQLTNNLATTSTRIETTTTTIVTAETTTAITGTTNTKLSEEDEDNTSVQDGIVTSCAPCALCRNLLRKSSTRIKHNIIQKVIDDELAKYTPNRSAEHVSKTDKESSSISNNSCEKDADFHSLCDHRQSSVECKSKRDSRCSSNSSSNSSTSENHDTLSRK